MMPNKMIYTSSSLYSKSILIAKEKYMCFYCLLDSKTLVLLVINAQFCSIAASVLLDRDGAMILSNQYRSTPGEIHNPFFSILFS